MSSAPSQHRLLSGAKGELLLPWPAMHPRGLWLCSQLWCRCHAKPPENLFTALTDLNFAFLLFSQRVEGGLSPSPWPPGLTLESDQKPPLYAVGIAYPSQEGWEPRMGQGERCLDCHRVPWSPSEVAVVALG